MKKDETNYDALGRAFAGLVQFYAKLIKFLFWGIYVQVIAGSMQLFQFKTF